MSASKGGSQKSKRVLLITRKCTSGNATRRLLRTRGKGDFSVRELEKGTSENSTRRLLRSRPHRTSERSRKGLLRSCCRTSQMSLSRPRPWLGPWHWPKHWLRSCLARALPGPGQVAKPWPGGVSGSIPDQIAARHISLSLSLYIYIYILYIHV